MKAIINPRTGIYKQLTEAQYRDDKPYFTEDGFREMTDKEIREHYGYTPVKKPEPKKETKPEPKQEQKEEKKAAK
jgi:hypothetical protein